MNLSYIFNLVYFIFLLCICMYNVSFGNEMFDEKVSLSFKILISCLRILEKGS